MPDRRPPRPDRTSEPAEGPRPDRESKSSLPPGARTKPSLGQQGDVDRRQPYEEDTAPERMEPQPFGHTD